MSKLRGLELIKAVSQYVLKTKTYGQCLENVKFISANNGNCIAEFKVGEEHLNVIGTLHGGCTSTIIDSVSTYALMTTANGLSGVSIDLHVTFLKPARLGDIVMIDARTIKTGRTLAFLSVELSNKLDGAIVARGIQSKYVGETKTKMPKDFPSA